jgi:hypothetical protein
MKATGIAAVQWWRGSAPRRGRLVEEVESLS